jgi:hypothetical protein
MNAIYNEAFLYKINFSDEINNKKILLKDGKLEP